MASLLRRPLPLHPCGGALAQRTWRGAWVAAGRLGLLRASSSAPSSGSDGPWIRHAGEAALLLRFGTTIDVEVNKRAIAHMAALDQPSWLEGVKEVLPTYASLFVKYDPLKVSRSEVVEWCQAAAASGSSASSSSSAAAEAAPRVVSIPVHYGGKDGPDIEEAAAIAGLGSPEEVARLHASGDYRVYFLGFLGGFPYLGGLAPALAKVPRLTTPRQKLPKGTVGVAGGQTGVYTISTPGGWYCLGRTQMRLFDPSQDPPAVLRAGDRVKFVPVDEEVREEVTSAEVPPVPAHPWIQILAPGPLTTVQDLGRFGYARHGVSRSGAADDLALRMGNALLGNEEGAAALEVTMGGLKLRCAETCAIALTGADCAAKLSRPGAGSRKQALRVNEVVTLQRGDEVELGFAKDGMRAYVCVQGGVDVPEVLGSRSTDIRAGLGGLLGRSVQRGDTIGRLAVEGQLQPAGRAAAQDPLRSGRAPGAGGRTWRLRVLPGPGDPQSDTQHSPELHALMASSFKVLPRADRMAVVVAQQGREKVKAAEGKLQELASIPYGLSEYKPPEMAMGPWSTDHLYDLLTGGQQMSEGCVSGTVQLPPDGNPVILLAEHQTTGGYKVPAVVIQADLWQVGQMRPGDSLRFQKATPEEAIAALRELRSMAREVKAAPAEGKTACMAAAGASDHAVQAADAATRNGLAEAEEPCSRPLPATSGSAARRPAIRSAAAVGRQLWAASSQFLAGACSGPALARGFGSLVPRSGAELRRIDLNADCGEGFDDAGLLEYVTSVNISCGAHAGTTESIAEVVRLAAACGAGIGAHVSFVDREGFGRRALDTSPQELYDQTLWQASALDGLCRGAGTRVRYIKPHGALYHSVMAGGEQGVAVFEAAKKLQLPLLLMPRSPWAGYGEGFAERRYDGDKLRPRDKEGAVIHEPHEAAEQAVMLAAQANIHSICVHGDSPNAVAVAREVRQALEKSFEMRPFCPLADPTAQ